MRTELVEELEGAVDDPLGTGARPVDLVHDDDRLQPERERLAGDEPRLRHRAFDRVHEQQHAVDHAEHALDLAAEVRVAGRVDDVDVDARVVDRAVLREDGDPALALEVFESITCSGGRSCAAKVPACCRRRSTSVVLPWSTWAMMAMLRIARDIT